MDFTYDMEEKERREEEAAARIRGPRRDANDWDLAPQDGRDEMGDSLLK